jgi:hypothetical protein
MFKATTCGQLYAVRLQRLATTPVPLLLGQFSDVMVARVDVGIRHILRIPGAGVTIFGQLFADSITLEAPPLIPVILLLEQATVEVIERILEVYARSYRTRVDGAHKLPATRQSAAPASRR